MPIASRPSRNRQVVQILKRLRRLANPVNVAGMARFGINPTNSLGISIPALRTIAKDIGTNHAIAQSLWASGIHEARILAMNWALRQIGKRNRRLNRKALATARAIERVDSGAARWIATDALRELTGKAVQERLTE